MESMRARQFVAISALHTDPDKVMPYATPAERADALADALRGVVLGGYDELICAWMVAHLNVSALRVILSLMERVRGAGMVEAVDAENALRARHPQRHGISDGGWNSGSCGGTGGGWISGAGGR